MARINTASGWLLCALAFCLAAVPAQAANLLVMGDDSGRSALRRDNPVFQSVLAELSQQAKAAGFTVYDETALTAENFTQGRVRRTDAELLDIARRIKRPPLDQVLLFTVAAGSEELDLVTRIDLRLSGRLLAVRTGEVAGTFDITPSEVLRVSSSCEGTCLTQAAIPKARELANRAATALTPTFAAVLTPGAREGRVLVFDGFSAEEMLRWRSLIRGFPGFRSERPMESGGETHRVWYESAIRSADLQHSLTEAALGFGTHARVAIDKNEFRVQVIKPGAIRATQK